MPKLNKSEAISIFVNFLNNKKSFVFVKFGDGELLCMAGAQGQNCDGHPYSPLLSAALRDSLFHLSSRPNTFIADWNQSQFVDIRNSYINPNGLDLNLVDYQSLLSTINNLDEILLSLYRCIKNISVTRKVILVIPQELNEIKYYIAPNSTIINVPRINAFNAYQEILNRVSTEVLDDAIIITACGMMAKVLISDLVKLNNTISALDFGSAFDPLLIGNTRLGQADIKSVRNFFERI